MGKAKTSTSTKKTTTGANGKKISPYNLYMKHALPKFKADNPGVDHKAAFAQVAKNWATAPENPKNKPKEDDET